MCWPESDTLTFNVSSVEIRSPEEEQEEKVDKPSFQTRAAVLPTMQDALKQRVVSRLTEQFDAGDVKAIRTTMEVWEMIKEVVEKD